MKLFQSIKKLPRSTILSILKLFLCSSHCMSCCDICLPQLMEASVVKARRAFKALKGIIRLQALIRGHLVRRQAVATLCCMYGIVKFQALVRGGRVRQSDGSHQIHEMCNILKLPVMFPFPLMIIKDMPYYVLSKYCINFGPKKKISIASISYHYIWS